MDEPQKTRRIKIVGSGTKRTDWRVLDAESGETISGVRRIEFVADAHGESGLDIHAEAVLYLDARNVEVAIDDITTTERAQELAAAERIAFEVERRLRGLIGALFRRGIVE